jgi:hypothetical protein
MKTAVEWLAEKLRVEFGFVFSNNILEQAKELEKEQLRECYKFAQAEQRKEFSSNYIGIKFDEWFKNYKNDSERV